MQGCGIRDARHLSRVTVRLLSLYLIARGIVAIPEFALAFRVSPPEVFIQPYFSVYRFRGIAEVSLIGMGTLIGIMQRPLSRWMVPSRFSPTDAAPTTDLPVSRILSATFGLFLCATSAPRLVVAVQRFYSLEDHIFRSLVLDPLFAGQAISLVMGAMLFRQSMRIAWRRNKDLGG